VSDVLYGARIRLRKVQLMQTSRVNQIPYASPSRTPKSHVAQFVLLFFCFSFSHMPTEVAVWYVNVRLLGYYNYRNLSDLDAFWNSIFVEFCISVYATMIIAGCLSLAYALNYRRTHGIDLVWMLCAGSVFSVLRWIPYYLGVPPDTTVTWTLAGVLPPILACCVAFRPSRKDTGFA